MYYSRDPAANAHESGEDIACHTLPDILYLTQSVGILRSLSLITFDGVTISLHPLTHEWIQACLTKEEVAPWGLRALCVIFTRISHVHTHRTASSTLMKAAQHTPIWHVEQSLKRTFPAFL